MCIPVGFMSYAAYNAYERERETSMLRQELAKELVALERRSGELEKNIQNLEDPRGIETELRSRYDVGWEGEEVIILVEEESSTQTPPVLPESRPNLWHRFIDVLF
ncbi:MAG: hypothetical protein UV60_C0011G0013 [Parcubacteria group bacterium GW2011_GWA2_43_11]|nr:MAG: hypothetical protein UV60_C0011G0013 [Parcubacteria group bacterium GW2011_GWA2_43_11]